MKYEYRQILCAPSWNKSSFEVVAEKLNDPKIYEDGWEFVQVMEGQSILMRRER